ncbi:hypothetical protein MTBUT4_470001 [Magnetospirillum sp. UT-4]|nr:hypothetical protein MTBUT4_470001 [Magnetospirillum sp. UT-4]
MSTRPRPGETAAFAVAKRTWRCAPSPSRRWRDGSLPLPQAGEGNLSASANITLDAADTKGSRRLSEK